MRGSRLDIKVECYVKEITKESECMGTLVCIYMWRKIYGLTTHGIKDSGNIFI